MPSQSPLRLHYRSTLYSLPNLFNRVKPTPKNRIAATGQIDQVILPFIMKSIPRKKTDISNITPMPYHHFFRPVPQHPLSIMLILS